MKSKKKNWSLLVGLVLIISVGFKSNFFEIAKQIEIYTSAFKHLNMYYINEINPAELTQKSLNHALKSLDPYTHFYDEQGVERARIKAMGEYGGIGLTVYYKKEDKTIIIREVLKGTPAEKAGLKPGDKILQIDDIVVKDFEGENASTLLKGLPKTKVHLKIKHQNKEKILEIERAKIETNPVPYYTMINNEIGYISFIKFNKKASSEVKKAFFKLKEQGMKKLILDVRANPGGYLSEAVNITNFFIEKDKKVVTTKAKTEKLSATYKTRNEPLDLEIPLVVLINNRSASASEIVSGSLQDYDRAVVVGERSFGKGLVQQYKKLPYGTQMKLTISKYYTPSGRCIQELDYANKDKDGNVPKFSDGTINKFKTEKGRIVYDGGGILPDVEIKKPKTTKTTQKLYRSTAFFNYVTHYFNTHASVKKPEEFLLNTQDYNDFKSYLIENYKDFKTTTENYLEKTKEKAQQEGLKKTLNSNIYKELLKELQKEKLKELDKNKEEIIYHLTEDIVQRYYYKEGVYKQKVAFDKTIKKAVEILNNPTQYKKILE